MTDPPSDAARDEPMAMTFPHLLLREVVALVAITLVLSAAALAFDAPLEELADPLKTPNPAKAPWYFLGLQELLHYYPPAISGVLLPTLLIVALAVIPYFRVNHVRAPLFGERRARTLAWWWASVAALTAVLWTTGAHPVWPMIAPLWFVALLASVGAWSGARSAALRWFGARSHAFWVFLWFVLVAIALTVVGVFFRGPGWRFILPWRDGAFL